MNERVICNGISWQQWRIVCRDVAHRRCWRTLSPDVAFPAHRNSSSSRQKTCQPAWFAPRNVCHASFSARLAENHPFKFATAYRTVRYPAANRNAAADGRGTVANRIFPPTTSCRFETCPRGEASPYTWVSSNNNNNNNHHHHHHCRSFWWWRT